MHLVVYFCGTGNPGNNFPKLYDYPSESVRTIFVKGCDEPEVCNSASFPDLKRFAKRFTQKLFGRNNTIEVNEDVLKSIGVRLDRSKPGDGKEEIESITLCGYSRGAVTCFEVAKQLNQLAPNIPVNIVADQPVPGNFYQGAGTNAGSIADCSNLSNLRNVTVILGSYTGALVTHVDLHTCLTMPDDLQPYKNSYLMASDKNKVYYINSTGESEVVETNARMGSHLASLGITQSKEEKYTISSRSFFELIAHEYRPEAQREVTSPIHRGFFSQILPKLPRTAERQIILIPRESHHQNRINAPSGEEHMHMQVAKYLHEKGVISKETFERKREEAKSTYSHYENLPANLFPPVNQLQSFFGLEKEEAYRYLDKLHPAINLRKGMTWQPKKETLIAWWNRQEKHASRFSTQLTKDLVKTIRVTTKDDIESLKKLFIQADKWLIMKENTLTSRYYQVESLRNNIYHDLVQNSHVPKRELAELNRQNLSETGYFLKHWQQGSKAASWFRTKETIKLDEVFKQHDTIKPPTREGDLALRNALGEWLEAKKTSQSKRYDLVVEMLEHLQDVIDKNYDMESSVKLQN
ncbi:hypothetical protein [Legionella clemsonensis]|uniref:Uncharacterized protein n=1 Tax=Legionella clemsonensis TaxID=1867846 RepID=A0A222P2V1_9GAMM|nr:hypothetical protein [Legionella clemsonensis]ASQ46095.1 hypothetical protein clem_07710 [Legionella clemsonensis]